MIFDTEDMRQFADRHRGKNITSGHHWSTIIRFPILFDEYEKLLKANTEQQYRQGAIIDGLSEMIEMYKTMLLAKDSMINKLEAQLRSHKLSKGRNQE